MRRRTLLVGGVTAIGGFVAFRGLRGPDLPGGMGVDTRHRPTDALAEDSPRDRESLPFAEQYHTVVADPETADRVFVDSDLVSSFVGATDFDASYLLVVQNGMQSETRLVLDAIRRDRDGLRVDVSVDTPRGGPDDLVIHSLLLRVTDNAGPPETVEVDIDGYP